MNQTYKEAVAAGVQEEHMTEVEKLQKELQLLTLENIKLFPEYARKWDDFYSVWQKFGPDAARTILIPYIWDGTFPWPSVVVKDRKERVMTKTLSKKVRRGEVEIENVGEHDGRESPTDV